MTVTLTNPRPTGWSKSASDGILDTCSWRYLLTKSGAVKDAGSREAAVGTAYHAAIEAHQRRRISQRRGVDTPGLTLQQTVDVGIHVLHSELKAMAKAAKRGAVVLGKDYTLDEMEGMVTSAVRNWWGHFRGIVGQWVPLSLEQWFNVPTPGGPRVRGSIDRVNWDPVEQEWVLVDDKSAKDWGRWPRDGAGHELEGALYSMAARLDAALPMHVARMEWHVVRTKESSHASFEPVRHIVRRFDGPEWQEYVVSQVSRAQEIVDTASYAPNPDSFLCSERWCPAFDPCQVTGRLAPHNVTVAG